MRCHGAGIEMICVVVSRQNQIYAIEWRRRVFRLGACLFGDDVVTTNAIAIQCIDQHLLASAGDEKSLIPDVGHMELPRTRGIRRPGSGQKHKAENSQAGSPALDQHRESRVSPGRGHCGIGPAPLPRHRAEIERTMRIHCQLSGSRGFGHGKVSHQYTAPEGLGVGHSRPIPPTLIHSIGSKDRFVRLHERFR